MVLSRISPSFNIAIPKEIRLALNLQPGDSLEFFIMEDGSIVLKKEIAYSNNNPQVAVPAIEWIYEDDEEEEYDEEEASAQPLNRPSNQMLQR
jgi:AbrB family looped-hinge helix DNA binding protein